MLESFAAARCVICYQRVGFSAASVPSNRPLSKTHGVLQREEISDRSSGLRRAYGPREDVAILLTTRSLRHPHQALIPRELPHLEVLDEFCSSQK